MQQSKPTLSLKGAQSVPPTELTEQPPVVTNEASPEKQAEAQKPTPEDQVKEQTGPTAKQMAKVEEENSARIIQQKVREADIAAREAAEPVSLIGTAAKGRQALMDQLREHAQKAPAPPYVPPPMTARQKTALQEEMAAGARAVEKAQAQQIRPGHPLLPSIEQSQGKEGVTNPVHRPGDFVPGMNSRDPALR